MFNLGFPVDFNLYFYHFTVICVFVNCCVNPFELKYDQFQLALQKLFCRKRQCNRDFLSRAKRTDVMIENVCTAIPRSDETRGQGPTLGDMVTINTTGMPYGGDTTTSVQVAEVVPKAEVIGSLESLSSQ
ncbi:hypothetical protein LSAT2_009932 [Lamellibrachia satsuma]|nr:hypothetical protein LSAT2_009932 [Lamellibrachia satsuma]